MADKPIAAPPVKRADLVVGKIYAHLGGGLFLACRVEVNPLSREKRFETVLFCLTPSSRAGHPYNMNNPHIDVDFIDVQNEVKHGR